MDGPVSPRTKNKARRTKWRAQPKAKLPVRGTAKARNSFPSDFVDAGSYWAANAFFLAVVAVALSLLVNSPTPRIEAMPDGDPGTAMWRKGPLVVLILCWGAAVVTCARSEREEAAIDRALGWLERRRAGLLSFFRRGQLLDWATKQFKPRPDVIGFYNTRVLRLALLIAVLYPFLLPMLGWVWSGAAMVVGEVAVFPAGTPWWMRAATIGGLVPAIALAIYQSTAEERLGGLRRLIAVALALAFAPVCVLAFVLALAPALALALALPLALAGAGAFLVAVWLEGFRDRRSILLGPVYAGRVYWLLATLLFGVPYIPWGAVIPEVPSFYLFMGLLPLINGVFDFLSYTTTLSLFRWGRHSLFHALLAGVFDVIAALVLFFALGTTLIFVITWANEAAGVTFYDLDAFLAGELTGQWWVYVMVFSTLLPTGLHFGHALISTLVTFPAKQAGRLRQYVGKAAAHPWAMIWAPLSVTLSGLAWFVGCLVIFYVPADYLITNGGHLPDWLNTAIAAYLQAIKSSGLWLAAL